MSELDELRRRVFDEIDRRSDELIAFGRDIWAHPEPGYREFRTSQKACEKLESLGLHPQKGFAETGFRADMDTGKPGPVVALLGEMDSLVLPSHPEADPATGAVHACGHHAQITALTGAAMGLSAAGVLERCSGKIALIGVPAEEMLDPTYLAELKRSGKVRYGSGKVELIRLGVFNDVDIAILNHAGGEFSVNDFNGYISKDVIFHGKSTHAALPDYGVNAMSAANLALHALALAKDYWAADQYVRVHGMITHAGDAVNIVPDEVRMTYMIRGDSLAQLDRLSMIFDRAVNGAAYSLGAVCEIITEHGSSPLRNSDALCEVFRRSAQSIVPGTKVWIKNNYQPGCTDMGDAGMIVPVFHGFFPGCGGGCHSDNFRITDERQAFVDSSKLLAAMALELLCGDAETGRKIAEEKKNKMRIPDYLDRIGKISGHTFFPEQK